MTRHPTGTSTGLLGSAPHSPSSWETRSHSSWETRPHSSLPSGSKSDLGTPPSQTPDARLASNISRERTRLPRAPARPQSASKRSEHAQHSTEVPALSRPADLSYIPPAYR